MNCSAKSGFAAPFDQLDQAGSLQRSARATDQHDQTRERIVANQRQKIVAIAGEAALIPGGLQARLLEQHREAQLDRPIGEVMTKSPLTIDPDSLLHDAVEVLSSRKISELPVVDDSHRPIGLIDITDVIGLMPSEEEAI